MSSSYLEEDTFNKYVVELLVYGMKERECDPSLTSNEKIHTVKERVLAQWCRAVNDQRGELSDQQVAILDKVNFPWRKKNNDNWENRYNELKDFKNTNNHCDVPFREESTLGTWVGYQRKLYHDNSPLMTTDRIRKLESIGIKWKAKVTNSWEDMFVLLSEYKEENSDCNVPSNYTDKTLANWVKKQRKLYKKKQDGEESSITDDQIIRLEGIGFAFVLQKGRRKKAAQSEAGGM